MIKATIVLNGLNSTVEADSGLELANFIKTMSGLSPLANEPVDAKTINREQPLRSTTQKFKNGRLRAGRTRQRYSDEDYNIIVGTIVDFLLSPARARYGGLSKHVYTTIQRECSYKKAGKSNVSIYSNRISRYLRGKEHGLTVGNIARINDYLRRRGITVEDIKRVNEQKPQTVTNLLGNPDRDMSGMNMFGGTKLPVREA